MKKILGLAAGFILTVATYAQSGVAFSDANDSYDKKAVTSFNFEFASNFTAEDIDKSAVFYTSYFTVKSVASPVGHTVTITLVEDNEMARRVVGRFFISMGVETIAVNGTEIQVQDFVAKYIML